MKLCLGRKRVIEVEISIDGHRWQGLEIGDQVIVRPSGQENPK
jgi:hypothetical protein